MAITKPPPPPQQVGNARQGFSPSAAIRIQELLREYLDKQSEMSQKIRSLPGAQPPQEEEQE